MDTGDLIHAIRDESVQAVARAWGISCEKVRRFRRALGVEVQNAGTHWLHPQYGRQLNDRRWLAQHGRPSASAQATTKPAPSPIARAADRPADQGHHYAAAHEPGRPDPRRLPKQKCGVR